MKQQSYALVFMLILLLSGIVNTSSANPNNKISTDSLWVQVKKHSKTSPKLALRYAIELQGEAQKNNNQEQEANALWAIGHINKKLGNFNEGIEAYFKVLPLYRELDDNNNLAKAYFNIAKIFTETKNDIAAEAFFKKALSIYTRLNNERGIIKTNVQLGKAYVNLKEYEKAETHLNIALTLSQNQDKKIKRKAFNWLGELERKRGNADLASEYYNKVIRLCEPQNLDTDKTKAIALLNIALTYYQNDDLIKAKEYATKSLALSRAIDIIEKQIKPQILLAEIAAKQNGENVREVKSLMATVGLFDSEIYNTYLQEAVYFISEKAQQKLLVKEELMEMNSLLGTQGRLSSALYEKTKVLLVQHSLQLSVDKVAATQKMEALERKREIQKWGTVALGIIFLGMLLWVAVDGKNKRRNAKKAFDVKIIDAEETIAAVVAQIKKKEIENNEAEVELDNQATLNVSLVGKLNRLSEENEDNVEQIEHMTAGLIESNTNMQMMNLYIWDVFKDVQRQGYKIIPPPWDMGRDRDN